MSTFDLSTCVCREPFLVAPDYPLVVARSGPTLGFAVFVNHQRFRTWRQYLQRLQKFNHSVLLILVQCVTCRPLFKGLAVMRFDRFSGRGELPLMHERPTLVIKAPQLAGDEFAVAFKESGRSSRLVLVERLTLRILLWVAGGADVMQLEI